MKRDFLSALAAQLFGQVARCWSFSLGFSLVLVVALWAGGGFAAEAFVIQRQIKMRMRVHLDCRWIGGLSSGRGPGPGSAARVQECVLPLMPWVGDPR